MAGKRNHEGYLLIDHRNSPGVPADIARRWGFDPYLMGEGKTLEAPTLTCAHCKGSVVLNPERIRKREYCQKCDDYVCDGCYALTQLPDYAHVSYMKISDLLLNDAEKGTNLGSNLLLMNNPKIRESTPQKENTNDDQKPPAIILTDGD